MGDVVVVGVPLGSWQTNAYVVGDREVGECVVIDPGQTGAERLPDLVDRLGLTPTGILLTHAHIDHLWSAPDLAATWDVPVFLHPDDRWLWENPARTAGDGLPVSLVTEQWGLDWQPDDERLADLAHGDHVARAGITFEVLHNPGHTPGHCTFLVRDTSTATIEHAIGDPEADEHVLFSGDLLFRNNIGRMDLNGGDPAAMLRSLATTVLPLPDDTLVLCGHGAHTTIAAERRGNPYLAEAARI